MGSDVEPAQLFVEQLATQLDGADLLLGVDEVLDPVARPRRHDDIQPVAAWGVAGGGHHLDDVAVLQPGPNRHHATVDPRSNALVTDIGVHAVGKIDRCRAARQRLHLSLRRKRVHLVRVQVDFQVADELAGVTHLLLPLEQLA